MPYLIHRRQSGLKSGGSWIRVKTFPIFSGNSTKIRFFKANFQKSSIFSGNFKTNSTFQAKIAHLQLLQGKLFYFLFKSHLFRTYFLYMIR